MSARGPRPGEFVDLDAPTGGPVATEFGYIAPDAPDIWNYAALGATEIEGGRACSGGA